MAERTRDRQTAARQLALHATGLQVIRALAAAQIRAILIKGAAIGTRLYDAPDSRLQGDVDLLIDPTQDAQAQQVLRELGFVDTLAGARSSERAAHAITWQRRQPLPGTVDLHTSLYWTRADPARSWRELSRETTQIQIAGEPIEVLSDSAQAFVIAAHAVQHVDSPKARQDLARALVTYDQQTWQAAGALAARLDAGAVLGAGLRLHPDGARLADTLGLDAQPTALMRLRLAGAHPVSAGVLRFAEAPTIGQKVRLIYHELAPSPAFMRIWHPLARRGNAGLMLAYAYRPLSLARDLPDALEASRRAQYPQPHHHHLLGSARRALTLGRWRAALWTLTALRTGRRQLRQRPIREIRLPPPPPAVLAHQRTTTITLRLARATCLQAALVRQTVHAAANDPRELIIAVNGSSKHFQAHAWLQGDPHPRDFVELIRYPPRPSPP
jgi:hypothetical protein